ncbi:hypothetical protein niasHS_014528 [Heterodera schachtii]|uniref:Transmembrane protein n=2 Tax=Heterodera TaxID=34509 RepID=A0ABD2IBK7_HETSC
MPQTLPYDALNTDGEDSFLGGWALNFFRTNKANMTPKRLANIPQPEIEYGIYCTFRTVELGALLGGIVAKPLYAQYVLRRTPHDKITVNTTKIARAAGRKLQGRILLASLFLGPLVVSPLALLLNGYTRTQLKERCYQIRCDERTIFGQRLTLLMGFAGWYWRRFQGAVDFIILGMAYTVLRHRLLSKESSNLAMQFVAETERYASPEEAELDMRQLTRFFLKKGHKSEGDGKETEQSQ